MDRSRINSTAEAMIAATRELIGILQPPQKGSGRLRVALFLTIAEQFEACVLLLRMNMDSHAAVHARSMLEALVYMNLLGLSDGYVDQMIYKQLKGQKKVLESILRSEYLPEDGRPLMQKKLDECLPDFEQKHKAGIRTRQIGEEMLEAGLSEMVAPYLMLCGFSHNDITVLALRHQGSNGMTYRASCDDEISVSIFLISIKTIVQAAEPLQKIALFPSEHFESIFQKMNNVWADAISACDG